MLFTLLDRAIRRRSPLARAKADFAPPLRIGRLIPVFAVIALGAALLTGCKKGATAASIGATPSGSTNMVISGTSQNASRALSITLNVVTE
jgi:hypothetical protein